jgi:hypothetical protein
MRAHESFLRRLEERFSRVSGWLAARQRGSGQAGTPHPHAPIAALRREIAEARQAIAETTRADLARVHASLDDLKRDYDVPPPRTALSRAELEAFRRHLHTTARLLRDMSTADNPNWDQAEEEYERSWEELERSFESEGGTASP